jgi:hypothetical protein
MVFKIIEFIHNNIINSVEKLNLNSIDNRWDLGIDKDITCFIVQIPQDNFKFITCEKKIFQSHRQ